MGSDSIDSKINQWGQTRLILKIKIISVKLMTYGLKHRVINLN